MIAIKQLKYSILLGLFKLIDIVPWLLSGVGLQHIHNLGENNERKLKIYKVFK